MLKYKKFVARKLTPIVNCQSLEQLLSNLVGKGTIYVAIMTLLNIIFKRAGICVNFVHLCTRVPRIVLAHGIDLINIC